MAEPTWPVNLIFKNAYQWNESNTRWEVKETVPELEEDGTFRYYWGDENSSSWKTATLSMNHEKPPTYISITGHDSRTGNAIYEEWVRYGESGYIRP